jgi:hypothetical protein
MLEYTKTYMKLDVLLLTDIFEKFRSICFEIYKMDPLHFSTSPSLSWNALLSKSSNVIGNPLTSKTRLLATVFEAYI